MIKGIQINACPLEMAGLKLLFYRVDEQTFIYQNAKFRNSLVEQWNSDGGTVWWNSGTLMVEQCDETVKTVMVEKCGGTFEQSWWNSVVEQWNSPGGTVWWNSGTVMPAQCRGTVEQSWCNSLVEQ